MNPLAESQLRAALRDLEEVRRDVERLAARQVALESVIADLHKLPHPELARLIGELAERALRERRSAPTANETVPCAACGRNVHLSHAQCLYCGAPRPSRTVRDG